MTQVSGRLRAAVKLTMDGEIRAALGSVKAAASWSAGFAYKNGFIPKFAKDLTLSTADPSIYASLKATVTPSIALDTQLVFGTGWEDGWISQLSFIQTLTR